MQPDPDWGGPIAFHEMLFGTWIAYAVLVVLWERLLRSPLPEWKYVLLTCVASSFYVINHYLNYAPFYYWLINSYTLLFAVLWYWIGIRPVQRSKPWQASALAVSILYTVIYISVEMLARRLVTMGIHEFWILVASYAGLLGVILWRGNPAAPSALVSEHDPHHAAAHK